MPSPQTRSPYAFLVGFLLGTLVMWPWVARHVWTPPTMDEMLPVQQFSRGVSPRALESAQASRVDRPGHTSPVPPISEPSKLWGVEPQEFIPLPPISRQQSLAMSALYGWVTFDRAQEVLTASFQGLANAHTFDVWLVEGRVRYDAPAQVETNSAKMLLGSVYASGGTATLYAQLERGIFDRWHFDVLVLTLHGADPTEDGLFFAPLTGLPSNNPDGQCPLAS